MVIAFHVDVPVLKTGEITFIPQHLSQICQ